MRVAMRLALAVERQVAGSAPGAGASAPPAAPESMASDRQASPPVTGWLTR